MLRTRAELDEILRQHALWIKTNYQEGKRADLSYAQMKGESLKGAELSFAWLRHTQLHEADLSGAHLFAAFVDNADLSQSVMDGTNLEAAQLNGTDFRGALLYKANLSRANIDDADFYRANLDKANMSGATLLGANFYEASVDFDQNPPLREIASVLNLDRIIYADPRQVNALRRSFREGGYLPESRMVTAAIRRHGQSLSEKIMFDWTCAWGSDWSHPMVLLGWLCLVCGPVYWMGMHFGRVGGIYQIVLDKVVATKDAREMATRVSAGVRWVGRERLRTRTLGSAARRRSPKLWRRLVGMGLRAEWRALRLAFLFSVLSALDIGFHEFNVGQWARMLLARDFNLKARGWMRVAGGVQSLVGLGLVALSLLSYFGHPFD